MIVEIVKVEIIKDCTDTGGFGVEGYEIKLTTNIYTISAFINMRNIVTTGSGINLHSLFGNSPYKIEFVDKVNTVIKESFKVWKPEIVEVEVNV